MVVVFGLRLWSNLGLPFACPGHAPTGFEPMETYPGHAKGSPKLDYNLKPKTKTIIPEEVPLLAPVRALNQMQSPGKPSQPLGNHSGFILGLVWFSIKVSSIFTPLGVSKV